MTDIPYLLERVGPAAVVQLHAEAFARLPLRDKRLAWHLYEAALAGRDIYFDQRYEHGLVMRDVIEALFVGRDEPRPRRRRRRSRATRSCSGSTPGPTNTSRRASSCWSSRATQLLAAIERGAARAASSCRWVRMPRRRLSSTRTRATSSTSRGGRWSRARRRRRRGHPGGERQQPLRGRHVGRPRGVRGDAYALNSRLSKDDDGQSARGGLPRRRAVWRDAGARGRAPRGGVRRRATGDARGARGTRSASIRTGEDADRRAYDIAWVADTASAVDTINGFIEVYLDARGRKGAWEGIVFHENPGEDRATSGASPSTPRGSRRTCRTTRPIAEPTSSACRPAPSTSSSSAATPGR